MGGEADSRPPVAELPPEQALALARRVEMSKIAVGVPGLLVSLFGVLLGFRISNRPLLDPILWFTLAGVAAVFAGYFLHVLRKLRRLRRTSADTLDGAPHDPGAAGPQEEV